MEKIAKFEKVSFEQFVKDIDGQFAELSEDEKKHAFEMAELPVRATTGSAGYDFYIPFDIKLEPGKSVKIATGIRSKIADGWLLMICPRSGLGFKYRLQIDNTVGIIDSDYYYSDNEGHIQIKITNDNREGKIFELKAGERFAQGIFLPYGVTEDDEASGVRNGGFGSTK